MYESFFQLNKRPFPYTPNADLYFPAAPIEQAHHTLARCIERAEGPGLLIGGPGTGKTLVCQMLADRFRESFHVVVLHCAQLSTRRSLLQHILHELGQPYRSMDEGELRISLMDFLDPEQSGGEGVLLVVDEAHTLPLRLFEDVRMMTNYAHDGQPRVRLVLCGGPLLEERFAHPDLECFNQRLAARCYLQPLNYDETCAFVRSQIAKVGGQPDAVFASDAWQAIYHAADGIPRLINQICDHALMLACVAQRSTINAAVIQESWADLQQLPTPWQAAVQEAPAGESVIEFGSLDGSDEEEPEDDLAESPAVAVFEPAMNEKEETEFEAEYEPESIEFGSEELEVAETSSEPSDQAVDLESDQAAELEYEMQQIEEPVIDVSEPVETRTDSETDFEFSRSEASEEHHSTVNPFDESFEQEEVVVDHYATLQRTAVDSPASHQQREIFSAMQTIFEVAPQAEIVEQQDACDDHPIVPESVPEPEVVEVEVVETETATTWEESVELSDEQEPEMAEADPAETLALHLGPEPTETTEDVEERVLGVLNELGLGPQSQDDFNAEQESHAPLQNEADKPTRAEVIRSAPADDNDMIVIVDDPRGETPLRSSSGITQRQEYRQLFSKLRQT